MDNEIDEFGINPVHKAFYFESMKFNVDSAKLYCESANEIINEIREGKIEAQDRKDELLNLIQNFINQCALISKFFWVQDGNTNKRNIARAKELREIFKIENDNPLQTRTVRNAIEHYDEKIDSYLSKGIIGHIIPSAILIYPSESEVPEHFFRAYCITTYDFYLLGRKQNIIPLIEEMARIYDILYGINNR